MKGNNIQMKKPKKAQCNCIYSNLDKHGQCLKLHDIIDQFAHLDNDITYICEDFKPTSTVENCENK